MWSVLLALMCTSCSSTPPPKPKPPPQVKYVPPPPPPIDDLLAEAREAEKVGLGTRGFTSVFGLDEAVRAYQRIVDNYPRSDEAAAARKKVKELASRTREIRGWQKRIRSAEREIQRAEKGLESMHSLFVSAAAMAREAPEGFIAETVSRLLARVEGAYLKLALAKIGEAASKASAARSAGRLREALLAYEKIPSFVTKDLPRAAREIEDHRRKLEETAAEKASKPLERAKSALVRRQERQAIAILERAWEEFRGFEIAWKILSELKRARILRFKVLTAEASGKTRRLDREFISLMESAASSGKAEPQAAEEMKRHLSDCRKMIDRYRAALEEMECSPREFEIRRRFIEKYISAEEKRMGPR